jgi:hypothetical protein
LWDVAGRRIRRGDGPDAQFEPTAGTGAR